MTDKIRDDDEAESAGGDGDEAGREFFMVAIGASAGGLEAIREMVRNLPVDAAAAYVVVQHMSPDHKSMLTTLIQRETSINVQEIVSGTVPERNVIYVTPPNCDVMLTDGRLVLDAPGNEQGPKPSVDRFFESAATEFGMRAVGIILSGTGSDGSHGIKAIRERGGITIVQDEKTAKYDGMPLSAIQTGDVDLILSPVQIGTHLARIIAMPRNLEQFRQKDVARTPLSQLLQIVMARTQVDFREYKSTTVQRRLERRMTAVGVTDVAAYTSFCREHPSEVDALFKDLLISVTRFFRDPREFFSIAPALRRMAEDRSDRMLRIWVVGCATGEEAYSLAILLAEAMGGLAAMTRSRVQIFATDIDERALAIARRGRYPRAAARDIPDELVERYFTVVDDHIQVHGNLKEVILFSEHNLCEDPPFLHLDLVCCRNLLIYFNASLQRKVLTRLHYALAQDGLLFLGTAETTSVSEELFKVVSREAHLYRRRLDSGPHRPSHERRWMPSRKTVPSKEENSGDQLDRLLFDSLVAGIAPQAILFSEDGRIVRVYGDVSRFIAVNDRSQLQFTTSVLVPAIAKEASALIMLALKRGERRRGIRHRIWDGEDPVQLEVVPIRSDLLGESFALIAIHRPADDRPRLSTQVAEANEQTARHVEMLEFELSSLREELQQTIEELETSNEELQATNEEMQSSNEELQSTNEELETSNEELQSTNEELVTVNEELQVSSQELMTMADEMVAVIASVPSPLLVVDIALQVVKANEAAIDLFSLRRPLERPHVSQIGQPKGFPNLAELCNDSLRFGRVVSRNILSSGTLYQMRCAPFSNHGGQIKGATVIFVEIHFPSSISLSDGRSVASDMLFYAQRRADGTLLNIGYENAQELFGAEPEALPGRAFGDFLDPESAERVGAADRAFLDSGRPYDVSHYKVTFSASGDGRELLTYRFRLHDERLGEDTVFAVGWALAD